MLTWCLENMSPLVGPKLAQIKFQQDIITICLETSLLSDGCHEGHFQGVGLDNLSDPQSLLEWQVLAMGRVVFLFFFLTSLGFCINFGALSGLRNSLDWDFVLIIMHLVYCKMLYLGLPLKTIRC